jgi:hypothetical protein
MYVLFFCELAQMHVVFSFYFFCRRSALGRRRRRRSLSLVAGGWSRGSTGSTGSYELASWRELRAASWESGHGVLRFAALSL